jgi:hypothetical protein
MWQTWLSISSSGKISRQVAPDFEISRTALYTHTRRSRKIERWGKITRKHDVEMDNHCYDGAE